MALVADGVGHAAVLTPEALTKSYRDSSDARPHRVHQPQVPQVEHR